MDLLTTIIILLAAFIHAFWNALVKHGDDHLVAISGVALASTVIALICLPFVAFPAIQSWPYLIASAILHSIYMISLSQAYRFGDFSQVYPIARGSAPILVAAWSIFILNEQLNNIEVLALVGIIVGIMFFSSRKITVVAQDHNAVAFALGTALMIAIYTIVDGVGVRLANTVIGYLAWMSIIESLPVIGLAWYLRKDKMLRNLKVNWKLHLAAGVLMMVGYSLVLWAMTRVPIPLVAALRESSIIIAALIGTFYFKEPSGKRRIIAAIVVCISVILLRLA